MSSKKEINIYLVSSTYQKSVITMFISYNNIVRKVFLFPFADEVAEALRDLKVA